VEPKSFQQSYTFSQTLAQAAGLQNSQTWTCASYGVTLYITFDRFQVWQSTLFHNSIKSIICLSVN